MGRSRAAQARRIVAIADACYYPFTVSRSDTGRNQLSLHWHAFFLAITTTFTELNTVMPALILEAGGELVAEYEKRTLLVYADDGELLRNHSLIPSGVEI